jgi:hypothetical protein
VQKGLTFFVSSDYYRRTNEIIDGINRSKKVKGLDKTNQVGDNFAKASIFQVRSCDSKPFFIA